MLHLYYSENHAGMSFFPKLSHPKPRCIKELVQWCRLQDTVCFHPFEEQTLPLSSCRMSCPQVLFLHVGKAGYFHWHKRGILCSTNTNWCDISSLRLYRSKWELGFTSHDWLNCVKWKLSSQAIFQRHQVQRSPSTRCGCSLCSFRSFCNTSEGAGICFTDQ